MDQILKDFKYEKLKEYIQGTIYYYYYYYFNYILYFLLDKKRF